LCNFCIAQGWLEVVPDENGIKAIMDRDFKPELDGDKTATLNEEVQRVLAALLELIGCLTKSKMIATHHMLEMLDMLDRRQTNQYIPRLSA
jgi:hypothetical protein